ncbi:MAG: serine/threonine protein kinase, partial [Halobacteriales archaeon]|nr:serine/threonine protein kinase [Halobacteriales archaeon]
TNWVLAALIAGNAVETLPGVFGTFLDDRTLDFNAWLWLIAGVFNTAFVYLLFLGFALDTPWTRWLKLRPVRAALIAIMIITPLVPFLWPQQTLVGPGQHEAGIGWVWDHGPIYDVALMVFVGMAPLGITAAVSAVRRATRGSPQRKRAKAYLAAFLTQDIGYGMVLTYNVFQPADTNALNLGNTLVTLAFCGLVATALLRTQLFDFELKLKAGFARGTVLAVFLGAFVLVTALAEHYVQQGGFIAGGATVAILLLLLSPIQRTAERVSQRVFPKATGDADYVMRKKTEVYQDALHEARLADATLDPSRNSALRDLRRSLGLSDRDHQVLMATLNSGARGIAISPGIVVLGKYRVERELGAGGQGRAFLAEDTRMHRKVVLKRIASGGMSATREARTTARVDHPNVVRVYDVEDLGGDALIVMEYVDGGSLRERLTTGGPLAPAALHVVAKDLLAALQAVHDAGAVHRDVKPSNVLLTRDGRAKLSDFGIAHAMDGESTMGEGVAGSVAYMSPEQAMGKRVTAASDLYSAAATLFEARSGQAFVQQSDGETILQMQMRIGAGRARPQGIQPPAWAGWFGRALAPEPRDRFPTATAMAAALPTEPRPKKRRLAAVAAPSTP